MSGSSRSRAADALPADHQRSKDMFRNMEEARWVVSTHQNKNYLDINNKEYHILDGTITKIDNDQPLVCVGSSLLGREILVLNPESEILQSKYQALKNELSLMANTAAVPNVYAILDKVIDFVRRTLKNDSHKSNAEITEAAENVCSSAEDALTYHDCPVIDLDKYIEKGAGVCRHHGLLNFYLIHELIKEGILPNGKVYHHRDNLSDNSAHTWCVYKPEAKSDIYFVDSLWSHHAYNVLDNPLTLVEKGYGKNAMNHSVLRYSPEVNRTIPIDIDHIPFSALAHNPIFKKDFINVIFNATPQRRQQILDSQRRLDGASLQLLEKDLGEYVTNPSYSVVLAAVKSAKVERNSDAQIESLFTAIKDIIEGSNLKVGGWRGGESLDVSGREIKVPKSAKVIYDEIVKCEKSVMPNYQETFAKITRMAADSAGSSSAFRDKETTQKFLDHIKNNSTDAAAITASLNSEFNIQPQDAQRRRV